MPRTNGNAADKRALSLAALAHMWLCLRERTLSTEHGDAVSFHFGTGSVAQAVSHPNLTASQLTPLFKGYSYSLRHLEAGT